MNYLATLQGIKHTDTGIYDKAKARLDMLAKPPGSLGKLEDVAARLCAITGGLSPDIGKRCVLVTAADNGVVAEGVSSAPQAVTAVQTVNILNGVTGVGVIARQFGADVFVADVGVNADISHPGLINRKIRKSTGNIAREPAMSREEAVMAIETGIGLVIDAQSKGYLAIGAGEMGIGNTTTSSAVLAALLSLRGDGLLKVTGRGAGLDDDGYDRKTAVIASALDLHTPDPDDPVGVLSAVGGLDIAAMTGIFIGAAYCGLPSVVDGFISAVAALCAVRLNPTVREYLFASHHSFEKGYAPAIEALGLSPCLSLDMRLGEGSGCPLMFGLMDAALAVFKDMATFGDANIDAEYTDSIKDITF